MAGNDNKLVTLADLGVAYTALSTTATTSANGMMSSTDKTKLEGIESGAQVNSITGVKGDAENSYRTGNVNITPANIGAVSTSSIANNLTTSTAGSVLDATQGKELNSLIDDKILYYKDQPLTQQATEGTILRIPATGLDDAITSDSVVLSCEFSLPNKINSVINWTSYTGYIEFTGIVKTGATCNANVVIGKKKLM